MTLQDATRPGGHSRTRARNESATKSDRTWPKRTSALNLGRRGPRQPRVGRVERQAATSGSATLRPVGLVDRDGTRGIQRHPATPRSSVFPTHPRAPRGHVSRARIRVRALIQVSPWRVATRGAHTCASALREFNFAISALEDRPHTLARRGNLRVSPERYGPPAFRPFRPEHPPRGG